jgi:2-C-methyl-D-erythritol 2,4-cyclodiphosphate synthase
MIGIGYDSHKLLPGLDLIIGGIKIDSELGVIAHSDGDVLLHALCDALLGAAGLGDIGEHFPDTDAKYKNADSSLFVNEVMKLISNFLIIINIDAVIILEKPKLADYKALIKENVAKICGIETNKVNIKAKSNEKMGFIGRGEGISAMCICELARK